MSLMEKFSNPEYIETLSMGEKLLGGLITTVMGIGITFMVLLLLWVIIAVVSKAIAGTENKTKKSDVPVTPVATPVAAVERTSDSELIAVITAAIAAAEGGASSNLIIKRISRVTGNAPAWSTAGRAECIDSRR